MNKFDFDLYDEPEETKVQTPEKPTTRKSDFDFDLYEEPELPAPKEDEVYTKYYKAKHYSKDELKKMSLEDRREYAQELNVDREYKQSAGYIKNALSELSFGVSERSDTLKPLENEHFQTAGATAGSLPFISQAFSLLQKGLKAIPAGYKWAKRGFQTLGSFGIGASHEAVKEVGKGEEINPWKIGFAGLGAAIIDLTFIQAIPGAYRWLKGLSTPQQEALLIKNLIPENMTNSQYKFYQDEVAPALQKMGQEEFQAASQEALQKSEQTFQQEMANVKALHENDLYKIQEVQNQHAARTKEIQEANEMVAKEFKIGEREWEATKNRENIVKEALENTNRKIENERQMNLTQGEDIGIRPEAPYPATTPLEEEIGNVISKNKSENPTSAGEKTTSVIRSSSKADQKFVANLYAESDALNSGIVEAHPELANELRGTLDHLNTKGNLTPQEETLRNNIKTTLDKLIIFNEAGEAVGFNPVENQFLLEQAKTLRNGIYYDFGESNATGIYNPTLNLYQDAASEAAIAAGNPAAAEANDVARAAHSEWARLYKNRYIRQWRNTSVEKPTRLYEGALDIDNYRQINKVLSRSNTGQNLSSQMRRDLINKKLQKYTTNPRGTNLNDFNEVLNDLTPILEPGEKSRISNLYRQSRKSTPIRANKIENLTKPKEPKLEKIPENKTSMPSHVKIPTKKVLTPSPEMKEAAKLMKITPEESMKLIDTSTGRKQLISKLNKTEKGNQLLEEIKKRKMKDLLYEGNVKKTYKGDDLFKIMNKENNYSVFEDFLGEKEAKELLKAAEEIGEENLNKAAFIKVTKNVVLAKYLHYLSFF